MKNDRLKYPYQWVERKKEGGRISLITAYDATFAQLISSTPIDAILIGDSAGMAVQGEESTIPVTLEQMIYHAQMVRRGARKGLFLIGDMPFGSYQVSVEQGVESAIRMMKEARVEAVKMEGADENTLAIIRRLTASGIPVMGHTGLTPQSYLQQGGFRIRGKDAAQATEIMEASQALEKAGCFAIVLELVQEDLAQKITDELTIPTIGIGSGPSTSGQVLVLQDLLGMDPGFHPRHVKRYCDMAKLVTDAVTDYHNDVVSGTFPGPENRFT